MIEIGCGGGRDALQLTKHYKYLGTDASKGMIEFAQQNVPSGEFHQYNLYKLSELDKKFDAFWAIAVLLHIPKSKIDEAFDAIKSVLKPSSIGAIAIKDGDKEGVEESDEDGYHEERLFTYWKEKDFRKALTKNQFEIVHYTYTPVTERTKWHKYLVKLRN